MVIGWMLIPNGNEYKLALCMMSKKTLLEHSVYSVGKAKSTFWLFVAIPIVFSVIFMPISSEFVGKVWFGWVIVNILVIPCKLLSRSFKEHNPIFEYIDNRTYRISTSVRSSHEIGVITLGDYFFWNILSELFKVGNIALIPNLITVPAMYIYLKSLQYRIRGLPENLEKNEEFSESFIPSMLIPKMAFYLIVTAVILGLISGALVIGLVWYGKVFR